MSTETISRFTPGPWESRISHYEREAFDVTAVGVGALALVKSEANARLIACAPELLDCLRAVEVLFGHLAKDSTQKTWLDNASAVIAKATELKP